MILNKYTSLTAVKQAGVIAVVRGKNQDNSFKTAEACIKGGVTAIELAFTSPNADVTIKKLTEKYSKQKNVIIGAGTVLDAATARMAIVAGAKFVVSPSFNKETAKICNLYAVPYIPGCFTPTEVQEALIYGSELVKIFPGGIAGQKIISEIHGPFPYVQIMPSGGVSLSNLKDWFDNGAFVVGVGGSLVGPAMDDNYDQVQKNASNFHEQFEKISNN